MLQEQLLVHNNQKIQQYTIVSIYCSNECVLPRVQPAWPSWLSFCSSCKSSWLGSFTAGWVLICPTCINSGPCPKVQWLPRTSYSVDGRDTGDSVSAQAHFKPLHAWYLLTHLSKQVTWPGLRLGWESTVHLFGEELKSYRTKAEI